MEAGSRFSRSSAETFVVDPTNPKDYQRVLEILEHEDKSCTDLIHMVGYCATPDTEITNLMTTQEARCLSTARLTQGLATLATPGALTQSDRIRAVAEAQRARLNQELTAVFEQLNGLQLNFH